MSDKECKSLGSTVSPPKDTVTAKTESNHAWENSYSAEHSTSSCGTQRLPGNLLKCHNGLNESLFLLGHLNNSSKKQNFTSQKDLKTSAAPIERRWEACLLRIFMWLVNVTIWIIQWKFAPLSAYTSQCLCHLASNSLLSHFIRFQGKTSLINIIYQSL